MFPSCLRIELNRRVNPSSVFSSEAVNSVDDSSIGVLDMEIDDFAWYMYFERRFIAAI